MDLCSEGILLRVLWGYKSPVCLQLTPSIGELVRPKPISDDEFKAVEGSSEIAIIARCGPQPSLR